jgi:hypothetical protein
MSYKILVSNGEILDKLSILHLKQKFCTDGRALTNITGEINQLSVVANKILSIKDINILYTELILINKALWLVEDALRLKEKKQEFDKERWRQKVNIPE